MKKEEALMMIGAGAQELRSAFAPLIASLILEDPEDSFYKSAMELLDEISCLHQKVVTAYQHRNDPDDLAEEKALWEELKVLRRRLEEFADEILVQESLRGCQQIQEDAHSLKEAMRTLFT